MSWFKNIAIKNKLFLGFGLLLSCLLIIIVTAFAAITSIMQVQETLFYAELPLTAELMSYRTTLNRQRAIFTEAVSLRTTPEKLQWINNMNEVDQSIETCLQSLQKLSERIPVVKEDILKLRGLQEEYNNLRDREVSPLLIDGKVSKALELISGSLSRKYEAIRGILVKLSALSEERNRQLMQKAQEAVWISYVVFAGIGIAGLIASIVMILLIVANTAKPIQELSTLVERVAYGDLTVEVSAESRVDEIGTLQYTFGMMIASLRQITLEVRSVAEALVAQVAEVGSSAPAESGGSGRSAVLARLDELGQRLNKLIKEYKL